MHTFPNLFILLYRILWPWKHHCQQRRRVTGEPEMNLLLDCVKTNKNCSGKLNKFIYTICINTVCVHESMSSISWLFFFIFLYSFSSGDSFPCRQFVCGWINHSFPCFWKDLQNFILQLSCFSVIIPYFLFVWCHSVNCVGYIALIVNEELGRNVEGIDHGLF